MPEAAAATEQNEYEIRDRFGALLYRATPELYRDIVAQTLTAGRYVHTFEIFREPRLTVAFRSISEEERREMLRGMDASAAEADMLPLAHCIFSLNVAGADIPTADDGGAEAVVGRLKGLPSAVVDKIAAYYGVFVRLVNGAFGSDDVVKNF